MRKHIFLILSIILLSGLIACSSKDINTAEQDTADETMTGHLLQVDTQKKEIHLNISDFINRGSSNTTDMLYSKTITYNQNTVFQDEQGEEVNPEEFKRGEKLAAIFAASDTSSSDPETVSKAEKIIQLKMDRKEKLDRFLAGTDNFHTVILYKNGTTPPYDEKDFEKHVPESFSGGISWVAYEKGLAVDYKEELNLEELPMILVFDREGVVFQTDSMEELKSWSEENR